jgi:sec-independent protein translocase protein TatB
MFDVGASELLVIGAVALIVIGPKDLPGLLRGLGEATTKIRRMAAEFRGQFDDAMREAELDQAKKAFTDVADAANTARSTFNPLDTIRNEFSSVRDTVAGAAAVGATTTASAAASEPAPVIDLPPPPDPLPVSLEPPPAVAEAVPEAVSEPPPKKRRRKAEDDAG